MRRRCVGDLLSHISISPAGGGIGLFFGALFLVLGFMLKRLETGNGEIQSGYKGLVGDMQATSTANHERAVKAERRANAEHGYRLRAEEYAYNLETRFDVAHRVWTYPDLDEGDE